MTLGETLKETRKQASLSQEQLAEKLGVSRSAVAKWETDNGIPDVGNLKVIAQLLNVSIDYLLDDREGMEVQVLREPYDLSAYGKGSKFTKKNRVVRDKFRDLRPPGGAEADPRRKGRGQPPGHFDRRALWHPQPHQLHQEHG